MTDNNKLFFSEFASLWITEEFLLDDIKNYRFLSGGKIPLTGVDDSAEFRSTSEAMGIMGIGPEEQSGTHTSSFVKFRL